MWPLPLFGGHGVRLSVIYQFETRGWSVGVEQGVGGTSALVPYVNPYFTP